MLVFWGVLPGPEGEQEPEFQVPFFLCFVFFFSQEWLCFTALGLRRQGNPKKSPLNLNVGELHSSVFCLDGLEKISKSELENHDASLMTTKDRISCSNSKTMFKTKTHPGNPNPTDTSQNNCLKKKTSLH